MYETYKVPNQTKIVVKLGFPYSVLTNKPKSINQV